jgi:hypothetical protein
VLLTPVWVTRQNMKATVIADGFVRASALCPARKPADVLHRWNPVDLRVTGEPGYC